MMVRKRGAGCESLSDTSDCECQICLNRIEEVPEESDPKVDKKAKPPSRAKKKIPICCAEFARKLKPKQKRRQGALLNGLMAVER